jgi:hypothetical protein
MHVVEIQFILGHTRKFMLCPTFISMFLCNLLWLMLQRNHSFSRYSHLSDYLVTNKEIMIKSSADYCNNNFEISEGRLATIHIQRRKNCVCLFQHFKKTRWIIKQTLNSVEESITSMHCQSDYGTNELLFHTLWVF